MYLQKTIKSIRDLKIQGAENVAKESLYVVRNILKGSKAKTANHLITELEYVKKLLFDSRPTEPCMHSTINCLLKDLDPKSLERTKRHLKQNIDYVSKHFSNSERKIVEIGSKKIRKNSTIFTHCHSSTVVKILSAAKTKKSFEVHNTETRPLYQGRTTAEQLAKKGIKVKHYVDSAARYALKKADLFLIGADAITTEGDVINKVGSGLFAEIARIHNTPVYVCTNSWKFDVKSIQGVEVPIENRPPREVWSIHKKNIKIENPAFERIDNHLINGIISEIGIYSPQSFVDQVQKEYPFLFS